MCNVVTESAPELLRTEMDNVINSIQGDNDRLATFQRNIEEAVVSSLFCTDGLSDTEIDFFRKLDILCQSIRNCGELKHAQPSSIVKNLKAVSRSLTKELESLVLMFIILNSRSFRVEQIGLTLR